MTLSASLAQGSRRAAPGEGPQLFFGDYGFKLLADSLRSAVGVQTLTEDLLKALLLYRQDQGCTFAGQAFADTNDLPGLVVTRQERGPLARQLREAVIGRSVIAGVGRAMGSFNATYGEGAQAGKATVPPRAFLAAVAEAYATRDWESDEPIRVSLQNRRAEVVWPAADAEPQPQPPSRRRPTALDLCAMAQLLVTLGWKSPDGPLASQLHHLYRGLPAEPVVEYTATLTRVQLPLAAPRDHSDAQRSVLEALASRESATRKDVEELTGMTQPSTTRILASLVVEGTVGRQGAGPTTRYFIVPED